MPITCDQRITSPRITVSTDRISVELQYIIKGTADADTALATLQSTAPSSYTVGSDQYDRQTVSIEPESEDLWNGTASYGSEEATGGGTGAIGDSSYSFDTGGGQQLITQTAPGTYTPYSATGSSGAPDFKGAINFDGQNVNGVDIIIPQYQWTETHIKGTDSISSSYKQSVAALTGKVNGSAFKDFSAGEVLFLGASGTRTGTEKWSITYKFAYSPNQTGIVVGDITDIDKGGWQYLWVLWKDKSGDDQIVKVPKAVYVHDIYQSGDFSVLAL